MHMCAAPCLTAFQVCQPEYRRACTTSRLPGWGWLQETLVVALHVAQHASTLPICFKRHDQMLTTECCCCCWRFCICCRQTQEVPQTASASTSTGSSSRSSLGAWAPWRTQKPGAAAAAPATGSRSTAAGSSRGGTAAAAAENVTVAAVHYRGLGIHDPLKIRLGESVVLHFVALDLVGCPAAVAIDQANAMKEAGLTVVAEEQTVTGGCVTAGCSGCVFGACIPLVKPCPEVPKVAALKSSQLTSGRPMTFDKHRQNCASVHRRHIWVPVVVLYFPALAVACARACFVTMLPCDSA